MGLKVTKRPEEKDCSILAFLYVLHAAIKQIVHLGAFYHVLCIVSIHNELLFHRDQDS